MITEISIHKHIAGAKHDGRAGTIVRLARWRSLAQIIRVAGLGVVTSGRGDLHHITAWSQVIEFIAAIRAGRLSSSHKVINAIAIWIGEQIHVHTGNAYFVVILHTVAIGIIPYPVANGASGGGDWRVGVGARSPVVAEICGAVVYAAQQIGNDALMRRGCAVFVIGRIGQASGQSASVHTHLIFTLAQIGEQIVAIGIGGGGVGLFTAQITRFSRQKAIRPSPD